MIFASYTSIGVPDDQTLPTGNRHKDSHRNMVSVALDGRDNAGCICPLSSKAAWVTTNSVRDLRENTVLAAMLPREPPRSARRTAFAFARGAPFMFSGDLVCNSLRCLRPGGLRMTVSSINSVVKEWTVESIQNMP